MENTGKQRSRNGKLPIHSVMCCFNEMTINKLKSKLTRTWIEETTNAGQVYRQYFTKKQVDKILQIVLKNNT